MTADVRTFKAASMQEALEIVRREMGADAVILHTRQLEKRRLFPWPAARQEVEITAGLGVNVSPLAPRPASTIAAKATAGAAAAGEATEELAPPPPLLAPRGPGQHSVTPPRWSPHDVIIDAPPAARRAVAAPTPAKPSGPPRETRQAAPSTPAQPPQALTIAARARLQASAPAEPAAAPTPSRSGNAETAALHQRLDALQRMILELGQNRRNVTLHDVPTELFQLYTTLLDAEVEDELARELVCRAKQHASRPQLADPKATLGLLAGLVEREFRCAPPIAPVRARRKVVALVGPTGVGKTTTLAKLAANFRLKDGVKLGLVTVDTYRIAAVEQLRTYAELIDLPMKVVTTPDEMRRALDEYAGLDLVLVDTAGRSPRDDLKIQELKSFLDEAAVDEVHLVLSLAAGLKALEASAANFLPVGVTSLILTKLDEATGAGVLFNVARRLKPPISYLTTGQNVPEDIEPAQATRMARLVLGQERLSPR